MQSIGGGVSQEPRSFSLPDTLYTSPVLMATWRGWIREGQAQPVGKERMPRARAGRLQRGACDESPIYPWLSRSWCNDQQTGKHSPGVAVQPPPLDELAP